MSFGGHNPYQPPRPPNGGPYPPPPGPYGPPQPGPYVPPRPSPPSYGPHAAYPYPQPHPYGPPPDPYPQPYPYVPRRPGSLWARLREDEWPPLGQLLSSPRLNGCVWAMAVMCAWPLVVAVLVGYPLARSARRPARRIFPSRGRNRVEDPEVGRIQKTRAWTATAMSLMILVAYGESEDVRQAQEQFMVRLTITPWLVMLSAPVVVAVLYRCSSPAARRAMRRPLRTAGKSALWYVGAFTAVPLLGYAMKYAVDALDEDTGPIRLAPFLIIVPFLWTLLFVVFASGPAVRGGFNTADAHAALPALITGVLVWEFAAIGLAMGGLPPGPPLVQFAALLGGPASVTTVAWWEIHRLRTRYGVVLRG